MTLRRVGVIQEWNKLLTQSAVLLAKTFPVLAVWVCLHAQIALLQSVCGNRKEKLAECAHSGLGWGLEWVGGGPRKKSGFKNTWTTRR